VATEVVVPMLGITVEKGRIVEWLKNEGDLVEKGESIFVVETEKATTEVESPASGILAKILVPAGREVPILTLAGVIVEPGEELPAQYQRQAEGAGAPAAAEAPRPTAPRPLAENIPVLPAARKLAQEQGVDLSSLTGTGPGGVIQVQDVEAASKTPPQPAIPASSLARRLAAREGVALQEIPGSGPRGRITRADVEQAAAAVKRPPAARGRVIPMDNMRQVISRRMSESMLTAPHIYFFTEILMDPLLDFRREVVPEFERVLGLKPSVNDFLIKAVALNLVEFPLLNATLKGEEIHIHPEVNVGLAVALEQGLIVPAIANADYTGLADIVRQRTDLVARARTGKLSVAEMERGTFTISSLAQYDITWFTAILNPPQSGILTVAKTREELFLENGEVKSRKVATFGLSVDHRIVDGAVAADFLQNLKHKLEVPAFTFLNL
jgi:pyruvate dehydrogenase E2 component (dihydrolipoamide acetyltransferase)